MASPRLNPNIHTHFQGSLPRPPSYTAVQHPVFPPGVSLIPPVPRFYAPGQEDPYVRRPVARHMPQPAPMGSLPRPPSYIEVQHPVFPPGVSLIPPVPRFYAPGQQDHYVRRPVDQRMPQPAPLGSLTRPPSYTAVQHPVFPPGVSLIPPVPRFYAPGQQDPYVRRPVAQLVPQPAPMMEPCYSQPSPYHSLPPHIPPAAPSTDYFSPLLPPSSRAPPVNRAHDSDYWGEKAREWAAAQDSLDKSSDVSANSSNDYDYHALLDSDDLVFPLEVPILPWMKMELARMDNIASPTTTKKKVKVVDVSVDVLSKILGLLDRYNPDRSPHKYEVSPSKPVPATPPLPPASQAPPPSPSHLESARTVDMSDSSRSRHKRHCSTVESGGRSKRPKLGEG